MDGAQKVRNTKFLRWFHNEKTLTNLREKWWKSQAMYRVAHPAGTDPGLWSMKRLVVLLFCVDGILVYRLETLFRFCQFFSLSSGQVLVILTDRWFLISEVRNALWSSVVKLKPKKLTRPIKTKVFMARSQSELDVADVKRGKTRVTTRDGF